MTEPTDSNEGLLMALRDEGVSDSHVLYFAGRPAGVLFDGLTSVHFISTDHLGTPTVASNGAGTAAGMADSGSFLRSESRT